MRPAQPLSSKPENAAPVAPRKCRRSIVMSFPIAEGCDRSVTILRGKVKILGRRTSCFRGPFEDTRRFALSREAAPEGNEQ
ncbi:MAG: hypothetical protein VYB96_12250, partial [Pseudomonadota bacterium]|nr:hypothetical protein [Pseudomonadota bacterium]